jgi:hypothetical protein
MNNKRIRILKIIQINQLNLCRSYLKILCNNLLKKAKIKIVLKKLKKIYKYKKIKKLKKLNKIIAN